MAPTAQLLMIEGPLRLCLSWWLVAMLFPGSSTGILRDERSSWTFTGHAAKTYFGGVSSVFPYSGTSSWCSHTQREAPTAMGTGAHTDLGDLQSWQLFPHSCWLSHCDSPERSPVIPTL